MGRIFRHGPHWKQHPQQARAGSNHQARGAGLHACNLRALAVRMLGPEASVPLPRSSSASKEYSLEKALEKMRRDWDGAEFRCIEYKDTGTYIIGGTDEIQAILDDQIVKTQSMCASPFIKALEKEANDWNDLLNTLQDMLDNWITCQGVWQYLEPIFSSPDIMKQMPEESEKFQQVDQTWKEMMEEAVKNPACLVIAQDKGRLKMLQECNTLLDEIQKGLAAYLEVKRIAFPRFFFLSNDEMLEILSETKDPLRVQPHLKKCFEGINVLKFNDKINIVGMISAEGENVPLKTVISPAKANGAVEVWLIQVRSGTRPSSGSFAAIFTPICPYRQLCRVPNRSRRSRREWCKASNTKQSSGWRRTPKRTGSSGSWSGQGKWCWWSVRRTGRSR